MTLVHMKIYSLVEFCVKAPYKFTKKRLPYNLLGILLRMNFNHQYGRPINGQAPYFPFGGASLPPWPLMGAPGAPPPFFMPPPVPPIDFRMLPNPLNPLLVYQTNNYYSPNVSSSSGPQTVNPYF